MDKLSPLRELFHELPNSINGINVVPFTFSLYLEERNYDKIDKESLKKDMIEKLGVVADFHKRIQSDFSSICDIIKAFNLPDDCLEIISDINKKIGAANEIMRASKSIYSDIKDEYFKEGALRLADELRKLVPMAKTLSDAVQKLRDRLVDLDKYH